MNLQRWNHNCTITHFMNEAMLADRVIVMNEGEVVSDSTPDVLFVQSELLRKYSLDMPLSIYVADRLRRLNVFL